MSRALHEEKIARVANKLRDYRSCAPVSILKKAVSHQVPKRLDARHSDIKIDLRDFGEIIEIDPEARTCTAEPGVTFVDLVAATLPYGLVPVVVPELKTITIGGAVSGCSLESTSFKYGGFHDTCLEYEIITAKGEILKCTPENEHAQVFQMIHGSFGTLGILSLLTFKLLPAKPFVHVVYKRFRSANEFQEAIRRHREDGVTDFMDGFVHAPDHYVLNVGRFVDLVPYVNHYNWLKVYFESTRERPEDFLKTADYFFRYDHGVTDVFPKSKLGRFLFGKIFDSATLLRAAEKLHKFLPTESPVVTVDLFFPMSKVADFLDWYERHYGHYPLWCVPYRRVNDYPWIASRFFDGVSDDMFLDLAIYGMKQPSGRNYYRELERELPMFNGIKTLISYNYYKESEFWRVFNRPNYLVVKNRVDPDNIFRDLYEKTCQAARGIANGSFQHSYRIRDQVF